MTRSASCKHFGLVLLALLVSMVGVSCQQFTFEVQAHTYTNPLHQTANNDPCRRSQGNTNCRNNFLFCLTVPGASISGTDQLQLLDPNLLRNCKLGFHEFQINNDDISFVTGPEIVPGENVANPLAFNTVTGPWPGGFQLLVQVRQDSDLVDRLNITREFSEREFTDRASFSGEFNKMTIELSFRLMCSANFYGENCDTFCVPRNDPEGRFTCNSVTGEIECLPGYSDPSNNCTTCVSCDINQTGNTVSTNTNPTVNPGLPAGGLSEGGVAGLVIGLLLILLIVAGLAVGLGIIYWMYGPGFKNRGKYDINKNKDALTNPGYEIVELNKSSPSTSNSVTSPAPLYTSNNIDSTLERTLDNDNPLYSSVALEYSQESYVNMSYSTQPQDTIQIEEEHDYAMPPDNLSYPPLPSKPPPQTPTEQSTQQHSSNQIKSHGQVLLAKNNRPYPPRPSQPPPRLPKPQSTKQHGSTKVEDNPDDDYTEVPEDLSEDDHDYAPPEEQPPNLPHSPSPVVEITPKGNYLPPNPSIEEKSPVSLLNPYGEYGEGTLKRVASQQSVDQVGETEPQTVVAVEELFDNPDYVDSVDILVDTAYSQSRSQ